MHYGIVNEKVMVHPKIKILSVITHQILHFLIFEVHVVCLKQHKQVNKVSGHIKLIKSDSKDVYCIIY